MKRRAGIEPLGMVLARDAAFRVPESIETSPVSARDWEAAVGSRIAARARPMRLERGVLTVRTATATWAQELALLSDAILSQLRGRGVPVDALRFRVGPVEAPERPPSRSEVFRSPPEVPLPPTVGAALAHIPDSELRDAIAHAAAKNLGWQAGLDRAGKTAKRRATSAPSGARAPRSAEPGSAPPARTKRPAPAGSRGKP